MNIKNATQTDGTQEDYTQLFFKYYIKINSV